jgi:VanZ family protein
LGNAKETERGMRSFLKNWAPVMAWMFLIFAGSTDALSAEQTSRFLVPFLLWLDPEISVATIAVIHFALRKLGHLTEYAILAALLWRALRATALRELWKPAVITLVIAAIYAALDEFHQSFVPTRTASENDVMIDIGGAIAGVMICLMFARGVRDRKQLEDRFGEPPKPTG